MVEDMRAARGIIVTHQTIRTWAEKFGRHFANEIKRRSAGRLGDKWHLDEMVVTTAGKKQWLWRAVDQDGFVLDVLVQSRRNSKAAKRLMRKLLKKQGHAPRVMITDKLGSYAVAGREIMPAVEHRRHKGLDNRAESSHQPMRRREWIMKRLRVSGPASAFRLHPRPDRQFVPLSPSRSERRCQGYLAPNCSYHCCVKSGFNGPAVPN